MSVFSDAAFDIIDSMSEAMGTTEAVYTPVVGDAVTIDIYLDQAVNPQPSGFDSMTWAKQHSIECLLSDLTAEPNKGDTFVVGGTIYTVQAIFLNDGYFVGCMVK